MRYLVFLFLLLLLGCANSTTSSPSAPISERRDSVLFLGMPFAAANAQLFAHGAHIGMQEIQLSANTTRQGIELHQYGLPNGRFVFLGSAPGKAERIVSSICVSTYNPKSFESKLDPEHQKFLESFEDRKEFDMEEPMPLERVVPTRPSDNSVKR